MKQKDPMEFNPYKYVDKENIYPRLDGVLHQGGYKVATNGCILIRYKCDYPQQFEGKVIGKNGKKRLKNSQKTIKNSRKTTKNRAKNALNSWKNVRIKPFLAQKRASKATKNTQNLAFSYKYSVSANLLQTISHWYSVA